MKDAHVLEHIRRLINEEHALLSAGASLTDHQGRRLSQIAVELDRCWDLLRQRRTSPEFARGSAATTVREPEIVERYLG